MEMKFDQKTEVWAAAQALLGAEVKIEEPSKDMRQATTATLGSTMFNRTSTQTSPQLTQQPRLPLILNLTIQRNTNGNNNCRGINRQQQLSHVFWGAEEIPSASSLPRK
jgi:hypothetical protein